MLFMLLIFARGPEDAPQTVAGQAGSAGPPHSSPCLQSAASNFHLAASKRRGTVATDQRGESEGPPLPDPARGGNKQEKGVQCVWGELGSVLMGKAQDWSPSLGPLPRCMGGWD